MKCVLEVITAVCVSVLVQMALGMIPPDSLTVSVSSIFAVLCFMGHQEIIHEKE